MPHIRMKIGASSVDTRWSVKGSRGCVACHRQTQWREWAVIDPMPPFFVHDVMTSVDRALTALHKHAEKHAMCERCARDGAAAKDGFRWLRNALEAPQSPHPN